MSAPAAGLFDEATLVLQAQGGDREAFAQLYDRYFERVYDFVRRTLRNEADAADVTQEVFIKAMGSVATLSNPSVFKSWLFTIARNLSISKIRGARQVLSLDYSETGEEDATLSNMIPDEDLSGAPEESAERADLAAMVWAVAAGLDARQYTVLDLSVRQELGPEEMAAVLGVTRNNAYVMINRTKAAFTESAGDYMLYCEGQRDCPLLRADLEKAKVARFSPEARKVMERHVKQCEVCGEKKKRLPLPLAMFGGLALAAPPEGLRERIRTSITSGPSGGGIPPIDGGPDAGSGAAGGGGRAVRRIALFALAALGALLLSTLAGIATLRILDDDGASLPIEPADETVLPVSSTPSGGIGGTTVTPTVTVTPSPAISPTPSVSVSPSPSTPSGATVTPAPNFTPTFTPAPNATATFTPTATSTATATATATATPSPTSTSTPSPTSTPTITPTATPTVTPTPSPTPVPLAFSGLTQRCWVSPNGNLRVTVTMTGVNNEPLSGSASYINASAPFAWNGNVGVAVIPYMPPTTGQTATVSVSTPTRQAGTSFLVTSTALCN